MGPKLRWRRSAENDASYWAARGGYIVRADATRWMVFQQVLGETVLVLADGSAPSRDIVDQMIAAETWLANCIRATYKELLT